MGDVLASASGARPALVRLETTSNQAFLATSSKARHLVAASELLSRSTTDWVRDALSTLAVGSAQIVTAVSGVAILVVDQHETGRSIVRSVTGRALEEAPGLIVHGAIVELAANDGSGLADALRDSALRLAAHRSRTGDGVRTDLMLPLGAPCPMTGRPSSGLHEGAGGAPVSEFVIRVEGARLRDAAFDRMGRLLTDGDTDDHVEGMADLMDRIDSRAEEDARWMAVVHADGNGIGGVFIALADELRATADLAGAVARFSEVSAAVDRAATEALRAAVQTVTGDRLEEASPAVLPLVCAGDDLTMLVEADIALDVTVAYAREFERLTREAPQLPADGLTVGAGVAITKPGHPILFGLELAEALAASAKGAGRSATVDGGAIPATVDLHVLHGSGGLGLEDVRGSVGATVGALPPSSGPWTTSGAVGDLDPIDDLRRLVGELADPDSPARALAQRLRSAAEVGRDAFDDVVRRTHVRAGGGPRDTRPKALDAFKSAGCPLLDLGDDERSDRSRARVTDALALTGVLTGAQRRAMVGGPDRVGGG